MFTVQQEFCFFFFFLTRQATSLGFNTVCEHNFHISSSILHDVPYLHSCFLLIHCKHYWFDIRHLKDKKKKSIFPCQPIWAFGDELSFTLNLCGDTWSKKEDSLLAEPVVRSFILSCIFLVRANISQSLDTGRLTLLWAADSSDRPATEIDAVQIENRARMAIMSS